MLRRCGVRGERKEESIQTDSEKNSRAALEFPPVDERWTHRNRIDLAEEFESSKATNPLSCEASFRLVSYLEDYLC
jgi:hypothetical protein